jgi:hypothetical protein
MQALVQAAAAQPQWLLPGPPVKTVPDCVVVDIGYKYPQTVSAPSGQRLALPIKISKSVRHRTSEALPHAEAFSCPDLIDAPNSN